ncbi:bacillithiol biosynthesis cysteine-adding enzyme BshC [soil metagenome]
MNVPFEQIPDFNELFIDYISDFEKVKKYYKYDFKDNKDFLNAAVARKNHYLKDIDLTREELSSILTTENKFFNSGDKTFANIELLKKNNTFAVVTGQQVGMFSGSLYTIIKALNCIQLSNKLNNLYSSLDYNFVPVFWLEDEDHDFIEINHINLINKDNELIKVEYYGEEGPQEKYLKPVGSIVMDEKIEEMKNEIFSGLNETDFTSTLLDYCNRSYKAGIDLKTAFARFLNYLLKDDGLIFIDPSDTDLKRKLIPVFEKELTTFPQSCEMVVNTSAELEHEYEPQIKPKPINLFFIHNGGRYLLEPREENIFALKNCRQKFTKEEIFTKLRSSTELFSPNVLLRPICQDTLLPTVAYVGGPSEVSYFAQFKDAYDFFKVPMPVIFPRVSITILESKVTGFLEKNDLEFQDLFKVKELSKKLAKRSSNLSVEEIFTKFTDEYNSLVYSFQEELEKVDKNLVGSLSKKNQQYSDSINILKEKFSASQVNQNTVANKQLSKILNVIYPANTLQERYLNILYFINKYGMDFIVHLKDNMDIEVFEHQVFETNKHSSNALQATESNLNDFPTEKEKDSSPSNAVQQVMFEDDASENKN